MDHQSCTIDKVKPSHVAFAAHPLNIVTCFDFDADKIIVGGDDTCIYVYDIETGKLRQKLVGHDGGVWTLKYDGNILVSGSTDHTIRVWDIEKGLCQQVLRGHSSTVRCLQILTPTQARIFADGSPIMQPEEPLIITGSRDSQLRLWRLPRGGFERNDQKSLPETERECPYAIRTLSGHTGCVQDLSAHGDTLVSGSYDSSVRVWCISTGECLKLLQGHTCQVVSVVFDHERSRCISGTMDSVIKVWDLTGGTCLLTFEGHNRLVGLFDHCSGHVDIAAADSTSWMWRSENRLCDNILKAHDGLITRFHHHGRKAISSSGQTVKLWDLQTGECVQDLVTGLAGVWQVKFDGRRCVIAVRRQSRTYIEILDFEAIQDGQLPEELGHRVLLNDDDMQSTEEEGV